jgi:hypothetical protein
VGVGHLLEVLFVVRTGSAAGLLSAQQVMDREHLCRKMTFN